MWKSHLSYKLWAIRSKKQKEKPIIEDSFQVKVDEILSPTPRISKFTGSQIEDFVNENDRTVTHRSPLQIGHVSPDSINKTMYNENDRAVTPRSPQSVGHVSPESINKTTVTPRTPFQIGNFSPESINKTTVTPRTPFQIGNVSPESINKTRLTPVASREASLTQ